MLKAKQEVPIELLDLIPEPEKAGREEDIPKESDSQLISMMEQLHETEAEKR
jgi:hypothetical protein